MFEKGDSKHDIASKDDYNLCREQVTSESGVDKVKEHFKLVRDLKPLDATDGMDAELDKTKSDSAAEKDKSDDDSESKGGLRNKLSGALDKANPFSKTSA